MKTSTWWWIVGIIVIIGLIIIAYTSFWSSAVPAQPAVNGTSTTSPSNWPVYSDQTHGFSIQYPPDFTVNSTSYIYTGRGPGKDISGVSFTIPARMTTGTNLSTDTRLSVEWTNGTSCTAANFLENGTHQPSPTDTVYTYDVASATDAAAGNRYEETVFVLPDCKAVRYFIHYGAIENYDASTTKAFDRAQLMQLFESMRRSFVEDVKG